MSKEKYGKNQGEGLRAAFKDGLSKLMQISTREQAHKQLRNLITQNKTTINLRVWLSVLSENRKRHSQSQINVVAFIIQQYGKGLLDPLDKIPSLEKTVFRVTQLLVNLYFNQDNVNVAMALQKVWRELYLTALGQQEPMLKKRLLYDCLEAVINGGANRVSQCTAQAVMEAVLEVSLNKEDFVFFKEVAKRALVLFLKTNIEHPAVLLCLQTVLGFFNIVNLIPLLENIVNKVISYVNTAQSNSIGYKIKAEASNVLALIGQQIDQGGVVVQEKVIKVLEDLATDKVWAVQATGRKALNIWKAKKKQWQRDYMSKNEQFYPSAQQFYRPEEPEPEPPQQRPQTASNFRPRQTQNQRQRSLSPPPVQVRIPDYSQSKYLHKNTGVGGGNTVQSVEQYYQRQKPQETYGKKMEQIKKSIYKPKEDYTEYDQTIEWQQGQFNPNSQPETQNAAKSQYPPISEVRSQPSEVEDGRNADEEQYLAGWERVMRLFEAGMKEESAKAILELDDDIYFLRYMLKYGKGLLAELTRPTAAKILKQMLAINKTHFMEQLLLKLASETAKTGTGTLLTTQQTLSISDSLARCAKLQGLERPATKVRKTFEKSLQ